MPYEYVSDSSGSRSGLPPTQAVVLRGRVREDVAVLRGRHAGARALFEAGRRIVAVPHWSDRSTDRWCRRAARAAAGTAPGCSASALRADSCRAAARLSTGAQSQAELVAVRVEAEVVVRVAVARFERQRVARTACSCSSGSAHLGEQLPHVELADRVERRRALTGQVVRLDTRRRCAAPSAPSDTPRRMRTRGRRSPSAA